MNFNPEVDLSKLCRTWLYRIGRTVYYNYKLTDPSDGRLSVRFMPDHTIVVISKTKHHPSYKFWDVDSKTKEVKLLDKAGQEVLRTEPYHTLDDRMHVLNIIGTEDRFITFDEIDQEVAPTPIIGGYKMAFYCDESWKNAGPLLFGLKFHALDINLNPQPLNASPYELLKATHDYLLDHPDLHQVFVAPNINILASYDYTNPFNEDKLIVTSNPTSAGNFLCNQLVGPRSLIIEFLTAVFIRMNKFELSNMDKKADIYFAFNDILKEFFSDRYIVK